MIIIPVQIHGVMTAFGRLCVLVDENTHAIHFFITALLQVRFGVALRVGNSV